MDIKDFIVKIVDKSREFGLIETEDRRKKKNVVIRKNINSDVGNVPYFGFIRSEE